jgi:serine/threonine protein phosphatase PrpC
MSDASTARSAAQTHPGRKRQQNQDSIHMDDGRGLWIVADGMGGHEGGEIASAIACEEIPERIAAGVGLEASLRSAHQKIVMRGNQQTELRGLGTTVVVVHAQVGQCELGWSGDSRIYRWRRGKLVQLSEDHSIVQRMLNAGLISAQQAKNHPHQHVISSCLGSTSADGLEIGYRVEPWEKGDWLLLCSDGLTDELEDDDIADLLRRHADIEAASNELLQAALNAGGRDNVSVALIQAPDDARVGVKQRTSLHPLVWGVLGSVLALAVVLAIRLLRPE